MKRLPVWGALLFIALGVFFRLYRVSTVPGTTADEGWWGLQAVAMAKGESPAPTTLSGNPTSPFLLYPMAGIHRLLEPSFFALRLAPLLTNLAMLPLLWWLSRRVFGPPTAWVFVSALSVFPVAIHCGRLAYDPSQSVLASGLAILLALHTLRARRWILTGFLACAAFAASLVVHPTNIFAAPVLLAVAIELVFRHRKTLAAHPARTALSTLAIVILLAGIYFSAVAYARGNTFLEKPWLSVAAGHLVTVMDWRDLAVNYLRLLNGGFVYLGVTHHAMDFTAYDISAVAALAALLLGIRLLVRAGPSPVDRALLVSWPLSLLAFHALAGPSALKLHYGLALVVPVLLLSARVIAHLVAGAPRIRKAAIGLSAGAAALLVATFHVNYFLEFDRTGGRGHRTYKTAGSEPKAEVLALILEKTGGRRVIVASHDWWCAWPLKYLATGHPNIEFRDYPAGPGDPVFRLALEGGRLFGVEYPDWPGREILRTWARREGLPFVERSIYHSGGQPLITVLSKE